MTIPTEQHFRELESIISRFVERLAANLDAPEPWPALQMLAMLRFVADEAGLAARCPDRRCQRASCCQAEQIGEAGPRCGALWSDDDVKRVTGAMEGIAFASLAAAARTKYVMGAIQPPVAGTARKERRGRKSSESGSLLPALRGKAAEVEARARTGE